MVSNSLIVTMIGSNNDMYYEVIYLMSERIVKGRRQFAPGRGLVLALVAHRFTSLERAYTLTLRESQAKTGFFLCCREIRCCED
jgi:hypothetical protein